ncbi:putative 6-hydroxy-D-nicotine oxidase [Apodospora peruviana]|uniref:6-hydroxy-D-nicotine oxidase n=1 Tax=Apodospora peruviana TaxID=516989 RepID=A0AAE0M0G4_9PEZI|nr:putative 6-hydroxy-D-nicotine oxidase [Apodospora peruviana]
MAKSLDTLVNSLHLSARDGSNLKESLAVSPNIVSFLEGKDNSSSIAVNLACLAATVVLGSNVVDTTPLNQSQVDANWSQACWQEPGCIIRPGSAQDVSKTLIIINFFQVQFTVRSGGHSPNPGWSSIDKPGLLLDLSRLDEISVSSDKKIVALGPGRRWGDVIAALDPYGVTVVGGRIPNVGVGGLMLGGGFSHFSGEYGMAADNVMSFEVVLASGTITVASAEKNSDLFWALKGGGPNFGIVTRFELNTIPIHDIWYEVRIIASHNAYDVLDAFAAWQNGAGASDLKSTIAFLIGLETITLGLVYSKPSASRPATFAVFDSIPTIAIPVSTNGTVLSLTNALAGSINVAPARHDYRAVSTKIDAQLYKDVYTFWREKAAAIHAVTGANQTFTLQPAPANIALQGIAKGGNPMGIPSINHQWWTTLIDWEKAEDDETVRAVSISTEAKWKQLSRERGLEVDYLFMNDASREQNPLASYGAGNIGKLKAIARKYDPLEVFQRLQNDGFLLRKA